MVRVLDSEIDIDMAHLLNSLDRVGSLQRLCKSLGKGGEVAFAELTHQRLLVLEEAVDHAGRILDFLGNAPQGHGFITVPDEECARSVKDFFFTFGALPGAAFGSSHKTHPEQY